MSQAPLFGVIEKKCILKFYLFTFFLAIMLMWTFVLKLPEIPQEQQQPLQAAYYAKEAEMPWKKDWHDYAAMAVDAKRTGIGENGTAAHIKDKQLKKSEHEISLFNGFNAMLSDLISVNRSVPDLRNKACRSKLYLAKLPSVSIVMPFNNEHLSVLLRSLHSIVNRSPPELLEEIIIVDDASTREYLHKPLEEYVAENFTKVKIVRLTKRTGLIGARLAGARLAKAQVMIFLDSHIEANYNWLPPLLEPIQQDPHIVVCPFIDAIDFKTFAYEVQDEGARGGFNWIFDYKRMPLLPKNFIDRTIPFESPVMAGGLFAISREFFWTLGGYDEGLQIWGGEQYELSFKIWMCGGSMLDAPCSRVGHIYRGPWKGEPVESGDKDYVRRNYKRVAEVWMDEYKQYLYAHDEAFKDIKPGNITAQLALREKLKCKPFKWFMEHVAFDLTKYFPLVDGADYANGAIQSVADPRLCIDTLDHGSDQQVGLNICNENLTHPSHNQNWALSAFRDLRIRPERLCLRVKDARPKAKVWLYECLEEGGDQFWYYDPVKQWLVFDRNGSLCLEAVLSKRTLRIDICRKSIKMKWKFGFVNTTALASFFDDVPDISYAF